MASIRINTEFLGNDLREQQQAALEPAKKALEHIVHKTCVGSEWTGWFDYAGDRGGEQAQKVKDYVANLPCAYDTVVVIGIGGSYLGARAVYESLRHSHDGWHAVEGKTPMIFLGHHLSEQALIETMEVLDKRLPLVNVISKTGTTTEPGVAFRIVRSYLEKRFGKEEARKRIVATTDGNKGALRGLAEQEGYQTFAVPDDIGGRFSVLTPVGLVPLALAGYAIDDLLRGADEMFKSLREAGNDHPVLQYAAARYAAYQSEKRIELLAFGEPRFAHLAEWWKQLFGESEGKEGKGLFPASLCYTTDLHSLGQYVQDGQRNLLETFVTLDQTVSHAGSVERRLRFPATAENLDELGYLEGRYISDINRAALVGTMVAHYDGGVPCLDLRLADLSETSIGALFAFFETACGVSAAMLGVNPYDQPGVEAYKKNLFGLLGKPGFTSLGEELRSRLPESFRERL